MLVLGVETSCDETSAAVVEDGRRVLSNVVSSQVALHAPYGGVVPEIASRQHVKVITQIVRRAIEESGHTAADLEVVGATYGPGLAGALLVGLSFGRAFALGLGAPFVPVNHLEGHLHSVWLSRDPAQEPEPPMPAVALVVSGGHTELVLMRDHGDYEVIGRTLDDAAGEAFDKVARLIGLPYPGGPAIERASRQAKNPVDLPRAWLPGTLDFSFSGLKTATLHAVQGLADGSSGGERRRFSAEDSGNRLTDEQRADLAAGFQASVVEVLVRKTSLASEECAARSVLVVGGVAANGALREAMQAAISVPLFVSAREFSTDNGAMIASAAYFVPRADAGQDVAPSLTLGTA